jgi:[ribosomal protein S5]-alanine N-acetyltransferase
VALRKNTLPTIATARLELRALTVEDADAMFAYLRDRRLTRYVAWERHGSIEQTVFYLMTVEKAYRDSGLREWGVFVADAGLLVGTCGFVRLDAEHARAELGYTIGRAHQGRGYGTEGAAAVMRFGFEELGLHRVEAQVAAGNTASARVLEKIGMRREAVLADRVRIRGRFVDVEMFAKVRRSRRSRS